MQRPGHCCTLIYTSGTTGPPKAVMISHDNLTWTAQCIMQTRVPSDWGHQEERIVSYLPLSHIAAQMLDIHFPMSATATFNFPCLVAFARPDALKGTLKNTLTAIRPTAFFGVPRVWEKMEEAMKAIGATTTGCKRRVATWAKGKGSANAEAMQLGGNRRSPFMFGLAKRLLSRIHIALGLDQCRVKFTGAAPISPETLRYFASLGIHIWELYGMSESSGPHTVNFDNAWRMGSVGQTMPGVETKIDHVEGRDGPGQGEILFRGRHIMMGYMKDRTKTAETIDPEGWLHSGDVGRLDETGMLYITGRIKELIITAGGENIAPVPIEDQLKAHCPAISNAMMVGDKRKFNVVLITLRTALDQHGASLDALDGAARTINPAVQTVSQAANDATWKTYIQNGIDATNKAAVSNAQRLQKFAILPRDFTVPGGELTATLKLKRDVVAQKYSDIIDG
mmetsp:Transcript_17363/g.37684  ORF Transcript_17363/g.37684 Transcript_17363/m.37684 type:complete len:452 (+) Transcript_17363:1-1356(+)